MTHRRIIDRISGRILTGVCATGMAWALAGSGFAAVPELAERALAPAESDRGFCLILDADDGGLAVEIARRSEWIVYTVSPEKEQADRLRKTADVAGLYGVRVVARRERLDRLTYPDHGANLLIFNIGMLEPEREREGREAFRILNPNGVALAGPLNGSGGGANRSGKEIEARLRGLGAEHIRPIEADGRRWIAFKKPPSPEWNEWTHRAYSPANPMGTETPLPAAPYRVLWNAASSPTLAAASVLMAGGRQIVVGPEYRNQTEITPSIHVLDAFNGVELWSRAGKKAIPLDRPLRYYSQEVSCNDMAADDRHLYLLGGRTCGVFDLRTGEMTRQFPIPPDLGAEEDDIWLWMALVGDTLYGAVGTPPRHRRTTWYTMFRRGESKAVFAMNRQTGERLWIDKTPAFANSLAIGAGRLYLWDSTHTLRALDLESGKTVWARPTGLPETSAVTLTTHYRGKLWVLFSASGHYGLNEKELAVFSDETGELLFRKPEGPFEKNRGFSSLAFSDGKVYARPQHGRGLEMVLDAGTGRDLALKNLAAFGDKCTPRVATPNFLLARLTRGRPLGGGPAIRHTETGETFVFEGFRPTCWYPLIPAYGMLYVQAPGCRCNFPFRGNMALASGTTPARDSPEDRLIRGPAFGRQFQEETDPHPWRSWRGGATRSGLSEEIAAPPTKAAWILTMPGESSPLASAEGMVFAGSTDHGLRAFDAATGTVRWRYRAEGAIRNAPYYWQGRIFVGDDDGWTHCLAAKDGALVWKFRVAPTADRLMNVGRPMSRWPAFGSVARDGVVYLAAGFLPTDSTWSVALEVETGKILWEHAHEFGGRGHLAVSDKSVFLPSWGPPLEVSMENPSETKLAASGTGRQSPFKGDVAVVDGEAVAALSDFTVIHDASRWVDYRQMLPLATDDTVYLRDGLSLTAENRADFVVSRGVLDWTAETRQAARRGEATLAKPRWTAWEGVSMRAAIKVGATIFSGSDGEIYATSATDGKKLWSNDVPGPVRDLAFNGGRLFALCEPATLLAFEPGNPNTEAAARKTPTP